MGHRKDNRVIAVTLGHAWGDRLIAAARKTGTVDLVDRDQACDVTVYILTPKSATAIEDDLRLALGCDYLCVEDVTETIDAPPPSTLKGDSHVD